jgi:hypothetical protein
MKGYSSFDTEGLDEFETDETSFEFEEEHDGEQDWDVRIGSGKHRCSCGGRGHAEPGETEMQGELPGWVPVLKKLYDAGRLGWKAGRWLDKTSGRVFGKPLSSRGAEFLYRHLGRSRRLEDFVDSLPAPVRRWLYSL